MHRHSCTNACDYTNSHVNVVSGRRNNEVEAHMLICAKMFRASVTSIRRPAEWREQRSLVCINMFAWELSERVGQTLTRVMLDCGHCPENPFPLMLISHHLKFNYWLELLLNKKFKV